VICTTRIAVAALGILVLCGCEKNMQNQEAVRKGVMTYLAKRSDLLAMDVSVTSVSFRQDEATAEVHFQAKGNNSPAAGMTMQYVLERQGGQWQVKGRTGSNSSHGASGPGVNSVPGQRLPGPLDGMPALPPGPPSASSDSTTQQR
jgi:hypothetical protein